MAKKAEVGRSIPHLQKRYALRSCVLPVLEVDARSPESASEGVLEVVYALVR